MKTRWRTFRIVLACCVIVFYSLMIVDDEITMKTVEPVIEQPEKIEYEINEYIEYVNPVKLSEHSITNYASGSNRNTNLAVACQIISGKKGLILEPGQSFDWLETVGQTTAEKGFQIAGVIVNRRHAEALGGGICQVASTLNSAVIEAGLETQCQRHSVPVGYLSSNDYEATVSYDSGKNLQFENTFDYPILIKMKAEGQTVTAKVFRVEEERYLVFSEKSNT